MPHPRPPRPIGAVTGPTWKVAHAGSRSQHVGYGGREAENGIVLPAGDRVQAEDLAAELPNELHRDLLGDAGFPEWRSSDPLRALFEMHGSARARGLASRYRSARRAPGGES